MQFVFHVFSLLVCSWWSLGHVLLSYITKVKSLWYIAPWLGLILQWKPVRLSHLSYTSQKFKVCLLTSNMSCCLTMLMYCIIYVCNTIHGIWLYAKVYDSSPDVIWQLSVFIMFYNLLNCRLRCYKCCTNDNKMYPKCTCEHLWMTGSLILWKSTEIPEHE